MPNNQQNVSCLSRYTDPEYLQQHLPQLDVRDRVLFLEYLTFLAHRNYAPATLSQNIATGAVFLRTIPGISLRAVTARDIEQFIEQLQDQGAHPATINCRLSCLSTFYRYLIDQDQVARNPILRRHHLLVPDGLPRAMSAAEYQRFLGAITSIRDRAMFLLLLRSGIRTSELVDATLDDLRLDAHELVIPLGRKNRRGRIVYFSRDAQQALAACIRQRPEVPSRTLFVSRRRGPLNRCHLYAVHRLCQTAGVASALYTPQPASYLRDRIAQRRHGPGHYPIPARP